MDDASRHGYTVYVVDTNGNPVVHQFFDTRQDAIRSYTKRAESYRDTNLDVCVYRGVDLELIVSTKQENTQP